MRTWPKLVLGWNVADVAVAACLRAAALNYRQPFSSSDVSLRVTVYCFYTFQNKTRTYPVLASLVDAETTSEQRLDSRGCDIKDAGKMSNGSASVEMTEFISKSHIQLLCELVMPLPKELKTDNQMAHKFLSCTIHNSPRGGDNPNVHHVMTA